MFSFDGITWQSATPATTTNWRNIAYGAGIFVAVAGTGQVMTAPPASSSGAPGLTVRQSLPLDANGECAAIDDTEFAYGSGLTGGWQRSWQPWPNDGVGGFACIRAIINVSGRWSIDNTAA